LIISIFSIFNIGNINRSIVGEFFLGSAVIIEWAVALKEK
jgi:hypothetical protein